MRFVTRNNSSVYALATCKPALAPKSSGQELSSFSERQGFVPRAPARRIRDDAPQELRAQVLVAAYGAGLKPGPVRLIICRRLGKEPDFGNETRPSVQYENRNLLRHCKWHFVYDIIEDIASALKPPKSPFVNFARMLAREISPLDHFHGLINHALRQAGVAWKLEDGAVWYCGEEPLESVTQDAINLSGRSGLKTTAHELREAVAALSRRPDHDLSGALQHAFAAAECAARHVSGKKNSLGRILKYAKDIAPPPIRNAMKHLWGYASEYGRHRSEGKEPSRRDVELAVHTASAVILYWSGIVDDRRASDYEPALLTP